MILIEMIAWIAEHWQDVSLLAAAGFLIRHGTPLLLKRLRLDHDEDRIRWLVENVEQLTGTKYHGVTEKSLKQAQRSLKRLSRSLPEVSRRGFRLRRKKRMNQTNWTTLLIALLGVAKLTLQPWGIEITDQHINDITNGFATALTIGGVIYHHIKQPKQPSHPFDTSSQAKGVTYNAQSQIADQPRI